MKRLIFTLLAFVMLAIAPTANAQIKRDAIAKSVVDGTYDSLLKKYVAGQELTTSQMNVVYYGSSMQRGFNPLATYPEVMSAAAKHDAVETLRLAKAALAKDPTNLALLFKAYASAASVAPAEAAVYQTQLLGVCDAIFHSGTGVTDTQPFLVVRPSDISEFLVKYIQPTQILGQTSIGQLEAYKVKMDGIADDFIFYFGQFAK